MKIIGESVRQVEAEWPDVSDVSLWVSKSRADRGVAYEEFPG